MCVDECASLCQHVASNNSETLIEMCYQFNNPHHADPHIQLSLFPVIWYVVRLINLQVIEVICLYLHDLYSLNCVWSPFMSYTDKQQWPRRWDPVGHRYFFSPLCYRLPGPHRLNPLLLFLTQRGETWFKHAWSCSALCPPPGDQETECERAARHHTEAPLKIHVYHSSSFIDGLSSLYVYEVRGLPVAPLGDPWGLPGCPRNCLFLLI